MDEHGLPIVGTGVDYKKIPPLEHRNTLLMLNQFIMHTAKFLNRFASVCEERLADLSVRIQKLDISLNILESKLNSIDGLQDVQASKQYEPPELLANAGNATPVATSTAQPQKTQSQKVEPAPPPVSNDEPIPPPASGDSATEPTGGMKIKDHPDYKKYFKMKRLGVNPLQIAMEMKRFGLDPDLLEDEDAPAPSGGKADNQTTTKNVSDDDDDDDDDEISSMSSSDKSDDESFDSD